MTIIFLEHRHRVLHYEVDFWPAHLSSLTVLSCPMLSSELSSVPAKVLQGILMDLDMRTHADRYTHTQRYSVIPKKHAGQTRLTFLPSFPREKG